MIGKMWVNSELERGKAICYARHMLRYWSMVVFFLDLLGCMQDELGPFGGPTSESITFFKSSFTFPPLFSREKEDERAVYY